MNVSYLFDPIDELHQLQMLAVEDIREAVLDMKMRAAAWEPRPCPPRLITSVWGTPVSAELTMRSLKAHRRRR